MIVKSRLDGTWVLSIFESFQKDNKLPKFKKDMNEDSMNSNLIRWNNVGSSENFMVNSSVDGDKEVLSWRRRFVNWFASILGLESRTTSKKSDSVPHGSMDPLKILLSVNGSLNEMVDCMDRIADFDNTIEQAKLAGQTARVERLEKARDIVNKESLLRSQGFNKFLPEREAVEFAEKCQKGLRLDWIANFTRPIPEDVIANKVKADNLMIFDNYVVMHYDPDTQAFALTKAQEEAKKDPILFGVIEGVRKLYFIGDWKDDICSLTLEEINKVLGISFKIDKNPTKDWE